MNLAWFSTCTDLYFHGKIAWFLPDNCYQLDNFLMEIQVCTSGKALLFLYRIVYTNGLGTSLYKRKSFLVWSCVQTKWVRYKNIQERIFPRQIFKKSGEKDLWLLSLINLYMVSFQFKKVATAYVLLYG